MNDRVFVDTNVLVYAHDADAGKSILLRKNSCRSSPIVLLGCADRFGCLHRERIGYFATEDLNHGQRIEGILIQNPFVTESVDEQKPHKSGD